MKVMYPDTDISDLTENQKQIVSSLSQIAAGLAGGIASDSSMGGVAGEGAGKNAVENNYLSDQDITTFSKKYAKAKTNEERKQLVADLKKLDARKQEQALATAIPVNEQKSELNKLKVLQASTDCNAQCQQLVAYSISELEPVANNAELHRNNLSKAVLASVIVALTLDKPSSGSGDAVKGASIAGNYELSAFDDLFKTSKPTAVEDNAARALKGSVLDANFAQSKIRANETFSPEGIDKYSKMAGQSINTVDDLANTVKSGLIKISQLPVDYVDMNGARLILNTRTSVALDRAGVPKSEWYGINKTDEKVPGMNGETYNNLAADQLLRNKLPETGSTDMPRGRK